MTFELKFFSACDHRTKSEPLIVDEQGFAAVNFPLINSNIRILEENIEVVREPVVRDTLDVDSLKGPLVTSIDQVRQELLHKGILEIREYRQSRDYILTGERLILWKDSATIKPNKGELYFVSYRKARSIGDNYRVIDANTIKLITFNRNRSYLVDYTTRPEYCTKCHYDGEIQGGVEQPGVMQDILYGPTGDFQRTEGVEKLKQDMIRAVLAVRASNPREPNYGTSISESIGKNRSTSAFGSLLTTEVRRTLQFLRQVQQIQSTAQIVDPAEVLEAIVQVKLFEDRELLHDQPGFRNTNPTVYHLSVVVRNAANNLVDFFVPLDVFSKKTDASDLPQIELSNISINNISRTEATISWNTNIDTDTTVIYGETDEMNNRESGVPGTRHFLSLTDLKPDTLYYIKPITLNRGFVFGAEMRTFKTLA